MGHEPKKPLQAERLFQLKIRGENYFLSSAFGAQHGLVQSAPHFFASFLEQEALSPLAAQVLLSLAAQQADFLSSAFFALHPQVSHAKAEEPATNKAIAAILIILFIPWSPLI